MLWDIATQVSDFQLLLICKSFRKFVKNTYFGPKQKRPFFQFCLIFNELPF